MTLPAVVDPSHGAPPSAFPEVRTGEVQVRDGGVAAAVPTNHKAVVSNAYGLLEREWGDCSDLRRRWGDGEQAYQNMAFYDAFIAAHPELNDISARYGLADHPALVEMGAAMGRRYAAEPGNHHTIQREAPKAQATREQGQRQSDADLDAQIALLQRAKTQALSMGQHWEADRLNAEQYALYQRRYPGEYVPA